LVTSHPKLAKLGPVEVVAADADESNPVMVPVTAPASPASARPLPTKLRRSAFIALSS
jgi:hypothetical protein